jgi:hypothetical protein
VTGLVPQLPALSERIFLVELNHRINNDFASAINPCLRGGCADQTTRRLRPR